MDNNLALDAMRSEVDDEQPPVKITLSDGTDAVLLPLLRLPQVARDTVLVKLRDLDSKDPSIVEQANQQAHIAAIILRTVAGEQLVNELNGDQALTMKVLDKWRALG
jgi:hypothetical protein